MLQGLGGPNGQSRQLPSPTPPAVLHRPPCQSSGQSTLSGVSGDRNSRGSRQESTPAAQRTGYGMEEAMAVAWRDMPNRGGGGSSTRIALDGRGGRVICSSFFHELVEGTTFVNMPRSCDEHRRCARGFVEDAIPPEPGPTRHAPSHAGSRARTRPYMRRTQRWTYTRSFNRPVVSIDRRTWWRRESRMTGSATAELHFSNRSTKRSTTPTATADSSRSATERREEDISGEWRDTNDLAPVTINGASAARGVWGATYRTVGGWLPPIASLAWSASRKTHGGLPIGGDDRFGVDVGDRTGVPRRRRFNLTEILHTADGYPKM